MKQQNITAGALCALILLVSACAATSTDRSTGQAIDDTAIEAKAKAALIDNPTTKAYDIDLEVFKGEVQLNGFVESATEKQNAETTVEKVAGVKSVRNNLEVRAKDRTADVVLDDSAITAKVKSELIADSRTKAYQIEVTTNNADVQLGGYVDSSAAKKAAGEIAKSVSGVKSVDNSLSVKGY